MYTLAQFSVFLMVFDAASITLFLAGVSRVARISLGFVPLFCPRPPSRMVLVISTPSIFRPFSMRFCIDCVSSLFLLSRSWCCPCYLQIYYVFVFNFKTTVDNIRRTLKYFYSQTHGTKKDTKPLLYQLII